MTTGIIIAISVTLITFAGITVIMVSLFKLLRHRADAAAMTSYRTLHSREFDAPAREFDIQAPEFDIRAAEFDVRRRRVGVTVAVA